MVNIVGNATAMMPVNDEVVAHLHEEQQNFYDGVSTFLAQRGSQPLSTSIHASAKPSGRFNRKPFKHYKENGNVYRNIANGYKGNNGRSYAANAPSMTVALKAEIKSIVATPKTAPVTNTEAKPVVTETTSDVNIEAKPTAGTRAARVNTEVTPNTASGVNPEAKPFVPAGHFSAGSSGLASNDQFMASARKFVAGGGFAPGKYRKSATTSGSSSPATKPRVAPARVLLFKNVPDWLNIPDVLGFVYGGAVDCIFRSNMAEITVQFCEETACLAYLEAHSNGIRVQHPTMADEEVTIIVEKAPRGEEVTPALQMKMATGGSRLVRVDGIFDAEKLQALTARAMEYEVDHIMFRTEKDKMGSAYVFFCGLADGWTFKQRLQEDEGWNEFVALFMADPCKVATAFHGNTIPNRMASAVAV